ncbi:hypothetical protein [Aliiglaciecola lipolytica]|uniref:PEP-CTERM protein-sorting domain-containing protein n=1 Tax=Aliiglaciecola lipolytica E3 TaxID=1127673 RepID=K6X688_9ALTE|nr:hypothetical protein [Aliiglaciecola lipolytica]GAC16139.1 hypothetical protein GLIP_3527 [Aliiglaciecola lipolytica E3]
MKFLAKLIFTFVIFSTSVKATLIEYEFDTLRFENNQMITGSFIYNQDSNNLTELAISLFGPQLNIEFALQDLTSPDAFSISFDNNTFGDSDEEGFQLFKDDVFLATGLYGLGAQDSCYEDSNFNQFCNAGLFTFQPIDNGPQSVSAPLPVLLILLGLFLGRLIRRS